MTDTQWFAFVILPIFLGVAFTAIAQVMMWRDNRAFARGESYPPYAPHSRTASDFEAVAPPVLGATHWRHRAVALFFVPIG